MGALTDRACYTHRLHGQERHSPRLLELLSNGRPRPVFQEDTCSREAGSRPSVCFASRLGVPTRCGGGRVGERPSVTAHRRRTSRSGGKNQLEVNRRFKNKRRRAGADFPFPYYDLTRIEYAGSTTQLLVSRKLSSIGLFISSYLQCLGAGSLTTCSRSSTSAQSSTRGSRSDPEPAHDHGHRSSCRA